VTTVDVNGPWLVANMLSRVQGEKVESTKVNHLSEGPSARERQLERENKDLVRMMEKKEREIVELRSALKQSTTGVSSQGPKVSCILWCVVNVCSAHASPALPLWPTHSCSH
jgi:hypothetical protein